MSHECAARVGACRPGPWAAAASFAILLWLVLTPLPLFHINPLGYCVIGGLTGHSSVIACGRFSASGFWPFVREAEATVAMLHAPPIEILKRATTSTDAEGHRLRAVLFADEEFLATFQIPVGLSVYGSTEVAWATIATPKDLREAPGTAGRPPRGTVVKLYDDDGNEVAIGETGRIFVGNDLQFEGYTGGGNKDLINGLMSSGDVGHFDDAGRLFVDGRDDDMIVSGGENVYSAEVENAISLLAGVSEVAVIGVPDAELGERVKAIVRRTSGSKLDEQAVRRHVAAHLANFKVPEFVEFTDEPLPRNAAGKLLKNLLRGKGTVPFDASNLR